MMQELFLFTTIVCVIAFGFLTMVKRPFDAMCFFLCFVIYRHIPSIFYLFGFDGGNLFFDGIRNGSAMSEMALVFMIFMGSLYTAYAVLSKTRLGQSLFPDYTPPKSDFMILMGLLILTTCAFFVAWIPIQRAGGIFDAINLVRNLNFYEGVTVLKKFVQFATFISCAYVVDLIIRKQRGANFSWTYIGLIFCILCINIFFSFIMGGKGFIVFPLGFMALTYAVCATKKPMRVIAFASLILFAVILSLQFVRITFVKESSIRNPVDYVYGALHFDVMDGNIIFIDTLGTLHDEELGETFAAGLAGVIPRAIWPDKPTHITAGGAFKQSLLPGASGGWPVFAYNQWYSSFGWFGVIAGGFLSGWVLRIIQERYGRMTFDPFSVYISYIFILYVLSPTGMRNEIFMNYIFFVVPLFMFKFLTHARWGRLLKANYIRET